MSAPERLTIQGKRPICEAIDDDGDACSRISEWRRDEHYVCDEHQFGSPGWADLRCTPEGTQQLRETRLIAEAERLNGGAVMREYLARGICDVQFERWLLGALRRSSL